MKIRPQATKTSGAMAKLLASHKDTIVPLKKGESVKGKIVKLTSSEILVDIGAKTTALVLEKEKSIMHTLLSTFKEGDSVEVYILTPESETGQPIVSLRKYLGNLAWKKLDGFIANKENIDVKVSDITKAGYVVTTSFGISGFLPQSHISHSGNQTINPGDTISVIVLELNRKDNKIIFSQKPQISDEDFAKIISKYKPEQKVNVTITNVVPFGLFISLPVDGNKTLIEGFIHISEISWDKSEDLAGTFSTGQKIDAVILKFDKEEKKVQLSIKRLTKDPFEEIMAKLPVDKKVSGTVARMEDGGVVIALGENIEGYIRKEKIPPTVSYKEGQELSVTVSEYDKRRKKIYVLPVLLTKQIGYR